MTFTWAPARKTVPARGRWQQRVYRRRGTILSSLLLVLTAALFLTLPEGTINIFTFFSGDLLTGQSIGALTVVDDERANDELLITDPVTENQTDPSGDLPADTYQIGEPIDTPPVTDQEPLVPVPDASPPVSGETEPTGGIDVPTPNLPANDTFPNTTVNNTLTGALAVEAVPEAVFLPGQNFSLAVGRTAGQGNSFTVGERPEFDIGFFTRAGHQALRRDLTVSVIDPFGVETTLSNRNVRNNDLFSVALPGGRTIHPGLYTLRLTARAPLAGNSLGIQQEDTGYVQEQNFTWGALAINTNKSIYLPNETALIGMSALNETGYAVCDANITLTITRPDNTTNIYLTDDGTVTGSPECPSGVQTYIPDYFIHYPVNSTGTYTLNLSAETDNGKWEIIDSFSAQNSTAYDVSRWGPIRTILLRPYWMNISVTPAENYSGLIYEYVPAAWEINASAEVNVTTGAGALNDTKIMQWNTTLVAGQTTNLTYQFTPPDASPEFYLAGALNISDWREAREWQIANDPPKPNNDLGVLRVYESTSDTKGAGVLKCTTNDLNNAVADSCSATLNPSVSYRFEVDLTNSGDASGDVDVNTWNEPADNELFGLDTEYTLNFCGCDDAGTSRTWSCTEGSGGTANDIVTTFSNACTVSALETVTLIWRVTLGASATSDIDTSHTVSIGSAGNLASDVVSYTVGVPTDDCGNLNADKTLINNVSATSGCFNITAEDITLNCNNRFEIAYGTAGSGIAVNASGYRNVTIKNCIIIKRTATGGNNYGIFFNNSGNATIINNTIFTNGTTENYGIYLDRESNSSRLENNTIVTRGTSTDNAGVMLRSSNHLIIKNNSIRTGGTANAYGVAVVNASNVTIGNNTLRTDGSATNNFGVYLTQSYNNTISENNIRTGIGNGAGSSGHYGVALVSAANNTVFNNSIFTNGSGADNYGVYLYSGNNSLIQNNTIFTAGSSGSNRGVVLSTSAYNNSVIRNRINTSGTSNDYGLQLDTASENVFQDNNVTAAGSNGLNYGLQLTGNSRLNRLVNNNISSVYGHLVISDNTSTTMVNYLIYNNSYGEIKWIDNGTDSFIGNLTLNVTNDQGLGLYRNLFIGNNISALNTSAFRLGDPNTAVSKINGTANITLYGLTGNALNVFELNSYTNLVADVLSGGSNCEGGKCTEISYASGTFAFNTSGFSSFATKDSAAPSVTLTSPASGSALNTSQFIEVSATVTDDINLSAVLVNITLPNSSVDSLTLSSSATNNKYNRSYRLPAVNGSYLLTIVANDTSNNLNKTQGAVFDAEIGCNSTLVTSYDLNGSLHCSGPGLRINASNVTLDCRGYNITAYGTSTKVAVITQSNAFSNSTIKNCIIKVGSGTGSTIVSLNLHTNVTLLNNTINYSSFASTAGISVSDYAVIINNTVLAESTGISTGASGIIHGNSVNTIAGTAISIGAGSNVTNNSITGGGIAPGGNVVRIVGNVINVTTSGATAISTSAQNMFIANNTINSSASGSFGAISFTSGGYHIVDKNVVFIWGSATSGLFAFSGAQFINFTGNTIVSTALNSKLIDLGTAAGALVRDNILTGSEGSGIYGIAAQGGQLHRIINNSITLTGSAATGMWPVDRWEIINNTINVTASNGIGVLLGRGASPTQNTSLINNIIISGGYEILDETGPETQMNQPTFSYDNEYGQIRWEDNSSNGFLYNLSVNVSNDLGIGLGRNIFIGLNITAVNATAFRRDPGENVSQINSSANISLFSISGTAFDIYQFNDFTTDPSQVVSSGAKCEGPALKCTEVQFSLGTFLFNTTGFSSFSARSNNRPPVPMLLNPVNATLTTNRTLELNWSNVNDSEGDSMSYELIIDDNINFATPAVNVTGLTNTSPTEVNYDLTTELATDITYFWKVRANDSYGYNDYTIPGNFTVQSLLSITLETGTVAFGTVNINDNVNTSLSNPAPFRIANTGNIIGNITLTGTPYFNSSAFPSTNYQFNVTTNESSAFNYAASQTSFINMNDSASATFHVVDLDWHDTSNDFLSHILLRVPSTEPPGDKGSTITFTITG